MLRIPRIVINDETTVYQVMSRSARGGFPLGDIEKDFMLDLIRQVFCAVFKEFNVKSEKERMTL